MRTIQGKVISTKMEKTIVVAVVSEKSHSKYHKKYKVTKKFYAHDENEKCKEGDIVTIQESRPLSKLKRWTLAEDTTVKKEAPKKAPAKKPAAKKTTTTAKKPATKKTTTTKKAPAKKPAAKKDEK